MYFIDNLSVSEIRQYRERTKRAINGIDQLLENMNIVLECGNIRCRYQTVTEYLGLNSENGMSFYNYFIPIKTDIIILLRFSNHNNVNPELYDQHERNGRPNKRFIFVFSESEFSDSGSILFLETEHHVVTYPVNALDKEESVRSFLTTLRNLLVNGDTTFTKLPLSIKENKNTRNMEKQTIRLNESQLRQIVKESVKNILNESYVWYGYVKPLKAIIAACYEITNKCKDYDFDDYESVAIYDLFRWAQQISDEAENFIEHNSDNVSIDY